MRPLTQFGPAAARPLDGPSGLAHLLLRSELWLRARLIPFQMRGRTLNQMLELVEPSAPRACFAELSPDYAMRAVRHVTRHPWVMRDRRCLREGLLAYRLLVEAGFQPRLHFGVEPGAVTSARVAAHCWVTLDGRTVIGESETPYVEIFVHPSVGTGCP